MSLVEYKRKRHFEKTPEPAGKEAPAGGRSFVIQKHQASHLHYDFRLELDGVLKSWAVPKGPNLDPSVKRLAMEVEDHPVDYGSFEGIIPEGEYGGGTVMLWDQGEWEPVGDPREGYRTGRWKFVLHGEKLKGGWMLVRTGGSRSDSKKPQWLLFKERDAWARSADEANIVESAPLSVHSGRSLDEIAADRDRVWGSKHKTNGKAKRSSKPVKPRGQRHSTHRFDGESVTGAAPADLPNRIAVELATLVKEPPPGDLWFHEIKFDGYRMICRIDGAQVNFLTRNHKNWTTRLPGLAEAAQKLPVKTAIFDGEIVSLRSDGTTDFQSLQNAFRDRQAETLQYFVFDLLYLDGYDLTQVTLEERKRLLKDLLAEGAAPRFHFSDHVAGNSTAFFKEVSQRQLEGIICKRRDSMYRPGRTYDWLKVKCVQNGEFVIGGYTEPTGSRAGFGALLMGFHDDAGKLLYAGKVGTGFDDATLKSLQKRLESLQSDKSPFADRKRLTAKTHWVEPTLVAQIVYGSRTREGILRHASFQGLREDKAAKEVTRDVPVPIAKVTRGQKAEKSLSASTPKKSRRDQQVSASPAAPINGYDAASKTFMDVRLTSPDKVLYPEQGITKLELAAYYNSIADWILPHMADRPLVLVRCPEGRQKACFYQKHPAAGTPDSLRQIPIREKNKSENYVIVDDVAGLISLAQIGTLEIHAWGSRADKLENPDRLIFDLDPDPSVEWRNVVKGAKEVKQFLLELGLESFVKTTGGKGLHLVVPIERRHDWEDAKTFCKRVADLIVAAAPMRYTANMSKAARTNKIFIDYLRNGRGATAILPYSTRARPGATVSMPLDWKELKADLPSDHFTIRNTAKRLATLKVDPWEAIATVRQSLSNAIRQLKSLPTT